MAVDVKVPAVGESVKEGMIHKWHKNTGDYVKIDDVILELETDKATVEVVAENSGVITCNKKAGDTVKVGEVIASIDTAAKKPDGADAPKAAAPTPAPKAAPAATVAPASSPRPASDQVLSPAVGRMVAEHHLDPNAIAASGKGGRLTKGDVVEHMAGGTPQAVGNALKIVNPTPAPAQPQTQGTRTTRREPMSMLRRRIAERLLEAQKTNAILTTFNEVDMSAVMNMRALYKDKFKEKHGVGLGFMSFFVKAAVEGLKTFPAVNGHIEGTDIVYHNYYDIGVAVSTDRGLMVPVIRNCDQLSFAQIESEIVRYGQKGREGKISLDDLSGGTFTVSNGGIFGSLLSTPIINPPQSAILGMHKIEQRPMVVNNEIVIRSMMYLAVSYDHRIIDGKEAVSFLVKVKECLEDPSRLMLGI
jgi:2-oxoglutarate dehydrogenase E2 component (dihydrolipoamide succinyltransferase)